MRQGTNPGLPRATSRPFAHLLGGLRTGFLVVSLCQLHVHSSEVATSAGWGNDNRSVSTNRCMKLRGNGCCLGQPGQQAVLAEQTYNVTSRAASMEADLPVALQLQACAKVLQQLQQ
jgi:hypothetical protein